MASKTCIKFKMSIVVLELKVSLHALDWFINDSFFSWSSWFSLVWMCVRSCICFSKFIISNSLSSVSFSEVSLVADEAMMLSTSLFLGMDPKLLIDEGANLGFFPTQLDMRLALRVKTGQIMGPNLVTSLPVTYGLTSVML